MKKVIALALIFVFLFAFSAFADTKSIKEEVVYGMLEADGTPKSVVVVNIFNQTEEKQITDYGNYKDVLNVTDLAPLTMQEDAVSFSSSTPRFYYQGTLKEAVLPFLVSITATLDGVTLPVSELSQKTGKVSLTLSVSKNENFSGDFFDNLMLQATINLSNQYIKNLVAEGATVINVGNKKSVALAGLPSQGINSTLTFDAVDFKMEAITIAAIPFAMEMPTPDTSSFASQLGTLSTAVSSLSTGINTTSASIASIKTKADTLFASLKTFVENSADKENKDLNEILDTSKALSETLSTLNKDTFKLRMNGASLNKVMQEMPAQIDSTVSNLLSAYDYSAYTPTSFASEKNGACTLVQFLMTTEAIAPPPLEVEATQEIEENFIQRLKNLFGL